MHKFVCDLNVAVEAYVKRSQRHSALVIVITDAVRSAIAANDKLEIGSGGTKSTPIEVNLALAEAIVDLLAPPGDRRAVVESFADDMRMMIQFDDDFDPDFLPWF
jgi:hypothetical protein